MSYRTGTVVSNTKDDPAVGSARRPAIGRGKDRTAKGSTLEPRGAPSPCGLSHVSLPTPRRLYSTRRPSRAAAK